MTPGSVISYILISSNCFFLLYIMFVQYSASCNFILTFETPLSLMTAKIYVLRNICKHKKCLICCYFIAGVTLLINSGVGTFLLCSVTSVGAENPPWEVLSLLCCWETVWDEAAVQVSEQALGFSDLSFNCSSKIIW